MSPGLHIHAPPNTDAQRKGSGRVGIQQALHREEITGGKRIGGTKLLERAHAHWD